MAELAAADLAAFTANRLSASDPATATVLAAALAAARRYCGWTVSPVASVTVVLDGPGGLSLSLPTLKLVSVTALSENGDAVDVSTLDVSRLGIVRKQNGGYWTMRPGGISVTMSHGFTEAEAADWRRAVLRLADSMAADAAGQRESADLTKKKVDDVEYTWDAGGALSTDDRLAALFTPFRILPAP